MNYLGPRVSFVGNQFAGAASFLRGQVTVRGLFERANELLGPQRTPGARTASQGCPIRLAFARRQEFLPTFHLPLLAPPLHVKEVGRIGRPAMGTGARPRPRCRLQRQSGPHRVQFRIAQRLPQVALIQRTAMKPPLPHMPAGDMRSVPISGLTPMRGLQHRRQGLRSQRDHHEMHVVRHQTVAEHRQTLHAHRVAEQIQINHPLRSERVQERVSGTLSGIGPAPFDRIPDIFNFLFRSGG